MYPIIWNDLSSIMIILVDKLRQVKRRNDKSLIVRGQLPSNKDSSVIKKK